MLEERKGKENSILVFPSREEKGSYFHVFVKNISLKGNNVAE
jgi:hypothetical protein